MTDISDSELAEIIVKRLNRLLMNTDTREDIRNLICTRVTAHEATSRHPSIILHDGKLGCLGLLNGIIGAESDGRGYIKATFGTVTGRLLSFHRRYDGEDLCHPDIEAFSVGGRLTLATCSSAGAYPMREEVPEHMDSALLLGM